MKLFVSNCQVFVWNAEDACTLRKDHRIVGSLVGCYPHKPFQNLHKWLPLQLLPEEATLLADKGIAKLFQSPNVIAKEKTTQSYFEMRDKLCEEQIALMRESRQKTILEKANEIYEGKKRKYMEMLTGNKPKKKNDEHTEDNGGEENLIEEQQALTSDEKNDSEGNLESHSSKELESNKDEVNEISMSEESQENTKNKEACNDVASATVHSVKQNADSQDANLSDIDKDKIIDAELTKIPVIKKELCMVQHFTECSWKDEVETQVTNWKFPSSNDDKVRYAVFKDLWERGYYLTAGAKFGGDFLVYEGDPLKYHALYIVICVPSSKNFQASDLVIYGRLGNQVKKTSVLASLNGESVEYISLKWLPEID